MTSVRTLQGRPGAWMASAVLLGVLTLANFAEVQGQRSDGPDRSRSLPSTIGTMGLPGLVAIPNAGMVSPGYAQLNYNTTPTYDAFAPGAIARQYNIQFAVGLFSRLVISGRGSEVVASGPLPPRFERGPDGVIRQVEWTALSRDLSASAQLLLLEETPFLPAVAIGAQDFGGAANHFEARYAVASKTLAGRIRLTAGYGWGDDLLKGAFGGIEASPIPQVTLVGEYDAERFNGGLRLQPFPQSWVARGAPRPTVDVIWTEDEGVTWGVSLRAVLDQDWIERESPGTGGQGAEGMGGPGPAHSDPGTDAVDILARLLAEDGFENVQVSVREGDVLRVEYENRRYNQHELDGLARVLRIVSRGAPAGTDSLRIVLKRTNLRLLQIDVASADLRRFLDGAMSPEAFQDRVLVRHPGATRSLAGPASRSVNSSFLKADLTLNPGIETVVFSDFGVADARVSLLPNLRIGLFRGTVLEAQYRIPIGQTESYQRFAGPLPDAELDRALLHHAEWWSLTDRAALAAQWSVGRFDIDNVGVRQEASLSLLGGLVRLGADVAALGDSKDELDRWLALGSARLHVPAVDTRLTVTAGRFLDEDDGVAVDLSRFFADTEIGVFLRHSGEGSLAGMRIALPLTFGKDLRPSRLRLRTPAEWRYQQQTVVFADRNVLRRDIARGLPSQYGLAQSYLDRDRLHPAAVDAALTNARFWR